LYGSKNNVSLCVFINLVLARKIQFIEIYFQIVFLVHSCIVYRMALCQLLAKDEFPWAFAEKTWVYNQIDKSISQCSFPAYRFFTRDTGCNDASGGFHQEIAGRPVSVKINGSRARGEMSFHRGAKNS